MDISRLENSFVLMDIKVSVKVKSVSEIFREKGVILAKLEWIDGNLSSRPHAILSSTWFPSLT